MIESHKIFMLTYKSYYYIAPTYVCELISRRESSVNTRLGADHHQLSMPPISKDCSNTFLERSFIYAAPCEWNKLSEYIRTNNFDLFRKSVKTMQFTQQISLVFVCVFLMLLFANFYLYNTALSVLFCVNKDIIIITILWMLTENNLYIIVIYVVITVNYCKYMLYIHIHTYPLQL